MSNKHYIDAVELFAAAYHKREARKFPCLRYEASEINYWLDQEDTHDFIFQFFLNNGKSNYSLFQLVCYVVDQTGHSLNALNPNILDIVKHSGVKLRGHAVMGNLYVTKQKMHEIIKKGNAIETYDYVQLIPKFSSQFSQHHIIYEIRLFKRGPGPDENIHYPTDGDNYDSLNPCPPAQPPKNSSV